MNDNCVNAYYCINGEEKDVKESSLKSKINCESCDDGLDPINDMCKKRMVHIPRPMK